MPSHQPTNPRKRMLKVIAEFEQLLRDLEWWNTHRTDCEPFDLGPERVGLSIAVKALAAWDGGDTVGAERLCKQLAEFTAGVSRRTNQDDSVE